MSFLEPSVDEVKDLIKVSRGSEPADLYLRGGTLANVYSGEYLPANVAIKGRRIAYVGLSEDSIREQTQVIDVSGKYLCPGYVEVHAHPWALYNPVELCRAILPLGTTSVFCDTLSFLLLMENGVLDRCLAELSNLPLNVFWSPRLVPQSVVPDQDVRFSTERIKGLLELPNVAGIFEITRWPLLLDGDPHLLECIAAARKLGKRIDGHAAGCSYEKLNSVVAAGVESCHEAIDAQQALDRLRLGMYVFLRDSSLREDLRDLIRIVTENKVFAGRVVLTTDGPSPQYFADKGSVEYLAKVAVDEGVDPMTALRMITLNPATYFHLDHYLGGIAPGRIADVVVNTRADSFRPELVIANGQVVARRGDLTVDFPTFDWSRYPCEHPALPPGMLIRPEHLKVRAADASPSFPVMDLVSSVIARRRDAELPVRDGFVDVCSDPGLSFITLLDRHGEWATNGLLRGFAANLDGLASSYNPAGHVLVLGNDPAAMALAANRVYELGGGIVLSKANRIIYEWPLEWGGMMSVQPFDDVVNRSRELDELLRGCGHPYDDVLYTLLFLSCDFLPEIRVSSAGIYDVKTRRVIRPAIVIR